MIDELLTLYVQSFTLNQFILVIKDKKFYTVLYNFNLLEIKIIVFLMIDITILGFGNDIGHSI